MSSEPPEPVTGWRFVLSCLVMGGLTILLWVLVWLLYVGWFDSFWGS